VNSHEIIERGRNADALLKNSLLNEAFEAILTRASREWLAVPRESGLDKDKREEIHARANGISEVRGQLREWLNDAVAEQARIEREEKRQKVNNGR